MNADVNPMIIQNIIESIPIGVLVMNSSGEIIVMNRTLSDILGIPAHMLKENGWGKIFFGSDKNIEFNQVIIDVIQKEAINLHRNVDYIHPSGKILRLSMTTSFLRENGGPSLGIVVLIDEVTELYHLHEQEKAILEEKNKIQHEKIEALKNLALAVAHQIRNPVTSIGGFAQRILKKTDKGSPNAVYLQNIIEDTARLEKTVQAVTEYTEYTDSKTIKTVETPLSTIIDKAHKVLLQEIQNLSKTVDINMDIQDTYVMVDPSRFTQALHEIFLNALEAVSTDQGMIHITTFLDKEGVYIQVSDNGRPISKQDRPFIFDPFFSTKAKGTGMGLSKAQKIITEHNGRIVVNSRDGKGTDVLIRLPYVNF